MKAMNILWEMWVIRILTNAEHSQLQCLYVDCCDSDVALQFNARVRANLTLIHESCPAGFEEVKEIILGRHSCQCSKIDSDIQHCNETTEAVLLKVRVLCAWCGGIGCPSSVFCSTHHCLSIFLFSTCSCDFPLFSPLQLSCTLPLPRLMQDWLWGTPITNSDGTKVLFTTGCSRGYCHCQLWYTDNGVECKFTVSQNMAERDQQCACNRKGAYTYDVHGK